MPDSGAIIHRTHEYLYMSTTSCLHAKSWTLKKYSCAWHLPMHCLLRPWYHLITDKAEIWDAYSEPSSSCSKPSSSLTQMDPSLAPVEFAWFDLPKIPHSGAASPSHTTRARYVLSAAECSCRKSGSSWASGQAKFTATLHLSPSRPPKNLWSPGKRPCKRASPPPACSKVFPSHPK